MEKILFLISSFDSGGAERVVSILANNYVEQGYKVDVLMLLDDKITYRIDNRINIQNLYERNGSIIYRFFKLIWVVRRYIKREKPDKIISFLTKVNIIGLLSSIGLDEDIYVSERNDPYHEKRGYIVNILTKLTYSMKNCKRVVFQTKYEADFFPRFIQSKGIEIYNPIQVSCGRKEPIHKIVNVGRLFEQKNQQLLINSFAHIYRKYPQYKLCIYGDGPLKNQLILQAEQLKIKEAVFFSGKVANIHECIADAEFFVMSSNYEGLSNALLEAMMMGIPCITTNVSGIDEIVKNGDNGLLVKANCKEEMVKAMNLIIEDKTLREKLGQKAKETSMLFKPSAIADKWLQVIGYKKEGSYFE